jgi:hypothetical protein
MLDFSFRSKMFVESLQALAERAKFDPYYPDPQVFTHQSQDGALICHLLEGDGPWAIWARDEKSEPAIVNRETLESFFRYLGRVVLPEVERVKIMSALHRGDIDWRVNGVTYVTRDHRTGEVNTVSANGPQEIANLLACLLAAYSDAEAKA